MKLILYRKIYNFIAKSFIYKRRLKKVINISLKEFLVCCQAFIEPHLPIHGIGGGPRREGGSCLRVTHSVGSKTIKLKTESKIVFAFEGV